MRAPSVPQWSWDLYCTAAYVLRRRQKSSPTFANLPPTRPANMLLGRHCSRNTLMPPHCTSSCTVYVPGPTSSGVPVWRPPPGGGLAACSEMNCGAYLRADVLTVFSRVRLQAVFGEDEEEDMGGGGTTCCHMYMCELVRERGGTHVA